MLIFLVLAGATNGVNLTDGLDGLAAGLRGDRAAGLHGDDVHHRRRARRTWRCCAPAWSGACVGFLWFNSFPAAVFMGDTGSLGLGGAIAALAVMTKTEVLLI